MINELRNNGYEGTWNHIDMEVVRECPCKTCGHSRRYVGLRMGPSYRAFAVCDTCEAEEEF